MAEANGQGRTGTERERPDDLTIAAAYARIRAMRGTVDLDLDLAELRDDRD